MTTPATHRRPMYRRAGAALVGTGLFFAGAAAGGVGATDHDPAPETAPPAAAATEMTVERVPAACADAIEEAEQVGLHAAALADIAAGFAPLIGRAFEAGYTGSAADADAVLGDMEALTARLESLEAQVLPTVERFRAARAGCTGGGV